MAMTIDSFRPVLGGAQLQIERLAPLLLARGVRPTVVTRRTHPELPRREQDGALQVIRIPVPGSSGPASVAYTTLGAAWLAVDRPAVVHAHGLLSAASAALIGGGIGRRPFVVKVLSSGPHGDLARLRTKPGGERRLRSILRRAAAFVCVSAEIERDLREAGVGDGRIVRIPNGVDVAHYRPRRFADGPVVGLREALGLPVAGPLTITVGRFDDTKRIERLIAAHAVVPGTLVIVGDGPERERLAAAARGPDVAGRVVLRSPVDDIAPYLRTADAYVTYSAQDGLSNAVLEAMASGLPVVAMAAGGMAELVDARTGILVTQTAPEAFGRLTAELVTDPVRAIGLGVVGRRRVVEGYALATTADRLAELYRQIGGHR